MKSRPMTAASTRAVALTSLVAGACLAAGPPAAGLPAAGSPTISWTLFAAKADGTSATVGKQEFDHACAICHGPGPDRPGTTSLQFKYSGSVPALLEDRMDLKPEAVRYYIRHGIAMMPAFRKTELSDSQVDAIAHYLARKR
jgi:mono/diheme cytochrome c family protein